MAMRPLSWNSYSSRKPSRKVNTTWQGRNCYKEMQSKERVERVGRGLGELLSISSEKKPAVMERLGLEQVWVS